VKNKAYFVFVYALITFIGGVIGFVKTSSFMSIFSATLITILLGNCGFFLLKNKMIAYKVTIGTLSFILAFFTYRYILTFKMMPAGAMLLLTIITLGYLLIGSCPFRKLSKCDK